MPFDPAADLPDLLVLYDAADSVWQRPDVLTRLDPDRWSAGEHLHHVEMVNRGVLGALRYLETGRGQDGRTSDAVRALLERGGSNRTRVAPASVQPPPDLDADAAAGLRASNRARWQRLDVDALSGWSGTLPHPLFGPLDAEAWLRFALVHARRHHAAVGLMSTGGAA